MDLDSIARELYRGGRDGFTAARDSRVRALKAQGETQLAREVAALRRPTVAAAAVNLLAVDDPERLQALLRIGDEMRQARDAAALRHLAEQQRGEVAALVRRAQAVGAEHGLTVSDTAAAAVEGTLRAAVADPAVAAQVSAGVLAREQQPSGFPGTPAAAVPEAQPPDDEAQDGQDSAAQAALAQAEARLEQAEQDQAQATAAAVAALARRDAVADELDRLRAAVTQAEQRAERGERDLDEARLREAHATAEARRARDEVARLRAADPPRRGRRSTPE
jgi:hypothetical protein